MGTDEAHASNRGYTGRSLGTGRRCCSWQAHLRCRRLCILPCLARTVGPTAPGRWAGFGQPVRHLLSAKHLPRSTRRYRALADHRPCQCADERCLTWRPALLSRPAVHQLRAYARARRAGPDGLSSHSAASARAFAAARSALSLFHPSPDRLLEAVVFRPRPVGSDPARDPAWNRGRYLVEAVAHCAECHSARNLANAIGQSSRFAGGFDQEGAGYVPNIPKPALVNGHVLTWSGY